MKPPRRRVHVAALAVLMLFAGAYAIRVPPGLPYDEPAHWADVTYVAAHGSMPIIGRPGSTYEAQMGPVAYYVDAVALRVTQALGGSSRTGFYAVRALGAPLLLAFFLLVRRLLDQALPTITPRRRDTAAAVSTLNPMVVAMGMSVQNDLLALVLAVSAVVLCLTPSMVKVRRAACIGVLTGLAILTKLTAWPVLPVLAALLLLRRRKYGVAPAVVLTATCAAVCGWWFIRNIVLYGDITARQALEQAGYHYSPYGLRGAAGFVHVGSQVVTYLWLPVEYFRNTIGTPAPIKGALAVTTLGVTVLGSIATYRRRNTTLRVVAALTGLSLAAWLYTYLFVVALAPRLAYVALTGWAVLLAGVTQRSRRLAAVVIAGTALVTLHVWILVAVGSVRYPPGLSVAEAVVAVR